MSSYILLLFSILQQQTIYVPSQICPFFMSDQIFSQIVKYQHTITGNTHILHQKCNKSDSTCMCTVSLAFPQVSPPSLWLPSGCSVHTQQIGLQLLLDWSSRFFAGVFLQYVCVSVMCDFSSRILARL